MHAAGTAGGAPPTGAGALRAMIWRMRGVEGVPTPPAPRWSRRTLLAVAGLGAAGALTGCRVRLEDDAPRVPLLPTRQPIPDEGALLRALADARDLRAGAAALGGARTATPARLAAVHARQVAVLEQVLRSARVPQSSYAATPSPATSAGSDPDVALLARVAGDPDVAGDPASPPGRRWRGRRRSPSSPRRSPPWPAPPRSTCR